MLFGAMRILRDLEQVESKGCIVWQASSTRGSARSPLTLRSFMLAFANFRSVERRD